MIHRLPKEGAISQKELDDSIQANFAAKASSVAAAKAAVEQAELNLTFSRITAPIDGVVGIAKTRIGDLVAALEIEMASMTMLDPIRVYINVSEQEYIRVAEKIRHAYQGSGWGEIWKATAPPLSCFLAMDRCIPTKGSFFTCGPPGRCENRDHSRWSAIFLNPDNLLRPGQFGRVRAVARDQKSKSASGSPTRRHGVARRPSGCRCDFR